MRIMNSFLENKRGQSTAEYVIVFVAVVSVALVAVPLFLRPAASRQYESTSSIIEGTANGIDSMAAGVPARFASNWSDYTFDPSTNMPINFPSYEEATSGWAAMQEAIGQTYYTSTATSSSSGSSGCGGPGQNACP